MVRSVGVTRGIYAYRKGIEAFQDDRFSDAADELSVARTFMPEDEEFRGLEAYYKGYSFWAEGKPGEAAKWFQVSLDLDPESLVTARMLLLAQRRDAFDQGKYEAYFRASEALLKMDGRTQDALLGMAPAWACRYVTTGREEYRQQALQCLSEARKVGGKDESDLIWIEGWVRHILETRSIVSLPDYWRSLGRDSYPDEDFG